MDHDPILVVYRPSYLQADNLTSCVLNEIASLIDLDGLSNFSLPAKIMPFKS